MVGYLDHHVELLLRFDVLHDFDLEQLEVVLGDLVELGEGYEGLQNIFELVL